MQEQLRSLMLSIRPMRPSGDGGRLGPDEAVDRVRGGGAITAGEVLLFLGA